MPLVRRQSRNLLCATVQKQRQAWGREKKTRACARALARSKCWAPATWTSALRILLRFLPYAADARARAASSLATWNRARRARSSACRSRLHRRLRWRVVRWVSGRVSAPQLQRHQRFAKSRKRANRSPCRRCRRRRHNSSWERAVATACAREETKARAQWQKKQRAPHPRCKCATSLRKHRRVCSRSSTRARASNFVQSAERGALLSSFYLQLLRVACGALRSLARSPSPNGATHAIFRRASYENKITFCTSGNFKHYAIKYFQS